MLQNALQHYDMKAFEGLPLTSGPLSAATPIRGVRLPEKILSSSSTLPGNGFSPEQMKHHFLSMQLSNAAVTQFTRQKSNL